MNIEVIVDSDLEDLIPDYLENMRQIPDVLKNALKNSDFETIKREGHKMKGHGSAYGFHKITEIGLNVQTAGNEKNSEELEKQISLLVNYLKNVTVVYR